MTAVPASMRDAPSRYRLYWAPRSAALLPELILEEAGLPYDKVVIDIKAGDQHDAAFLAVNPAGHVPALALPEGGVVTETAAIALFLCDRHDLFLAPAPDEADRAAFLRAVLTLSNGPQSTYKRYFYAERFSTDPADAPRIKARAYEQAEDQWGLIEGMLEQADGPFFLGRRFSAADLYLAMLLCWHREAQDLLARRPAVARCFGETTARPIVSRILSEQGHLPL